MKQDVLDVLMYLFEEVAVEGVELNIDDDTVVEQLERAGFDTPEIQRAFRWLDDLIAFEGSALEKSHVPSIRVYDRQEVLKIGTESRGLIQHLENVGVLDPLIRELVIDRLMALDAEKIDIDDVKWVIMVVLINRPGFEAEFAWMEDFVYDGGTHALH